MPYIFMVLKSWPGQNNVNRKHSKSWIGVLKDSFVTGECALNTAFHCISNEPIFCMTGVEQRRAKQANIICIDQRAKTIFQRRMCFEVRVNVQVRELKSFNEAFTEALEKSSTKHALVLYKDASQLKRFIPKCLSGSFGATKHDAMPSN